MYFALYLEHDNRNGVESVSGDFHQWLIIFQHHRGTGQQRDNIDPKGRQGDDWKEAQQHSQLP